MDKKMDTVENTAAASSDTTLIGPRVTEAIRNLILTGELAPGSRIGQEELAGRFGVSRLPVRDALSRLESDGLVILKASSGAWVARLDLKECIEIYKIRERLEPLALTEAVKNISDADIEELAALVESIAGAKDDEEFLRLDREFHLACYRAANMRQLQSMAEKFWNTTQHYRRLFIQTVIRTNRWVIDAEHRLMIDAIRRRDGEGAGNVLFEHIRRTRFELERNASIFPEDHVPEGKSRRRKRR
jgi:DNA-binding GntR family transcriptional regulator